jgi:drug/metabolite transporter (DMT)-like permease
MHGVTPPQRPGAKTARRSLLELHLAVFLWGFTALFAKILALPVVTIVCVRSFVAAAALFALAAYYGIPFRTRSRKVSGYVLLAGLVLAGHWLTYFQAVRVSTVAVGIVALHTHPVITTLLEPLFARERLRGLDVLAAVVVFAGVVILVPDFSLSNSSLQGVLLGVASAACVSIRALLTRDTIQDHPGTTLTMHMTLISGIVLIPFAARAGVVPSPAQWAPLLVLGVALTAVPHLLFTLSLKDLSARTVSIITSVLPIYGVVFAFLVLGERPGLRTLIGGAVILAVAAVEQVRAAR